MTHFKTFRLSVLAACAATCLAPQLGAAQAPAPTPAPAPARPPPPPPVLPTTQLPAIVWPDPGVVPRMVAGPGLPSTIDYRALNVPPAPPKAPEGFTPIFNGRDLSGWHISKSSHHGLTPEYRVVAGLIVSTQSPIGGGGMLVSDKKYRNYELYLEAKGDWGSDSGVFLRTNEEGAAYQLTLDYLPGGSMGRIISEGGLVGVGRPLGQETAPAAPPAAPSGPPQLDKGMAIWKHNDWNSVRVRVEGDNPHMMVWINDQLITDFTDPANRAVGGMVEGPFALQVHGGLNRWLPGNFWRWRNIAIKELPAR